MDVLQLKTIIENQISAQCPDDFSSGKGIAYIYKDYEESEYMGRWGGTITKETEPFCGQHSLKNPERIIDDVSVPLYQFSQVSIE